ncbi:MAG: hypothetical protein KA536_11560 [Saprospiraceae bacterium]|nr:hypothetical protein [Saprospiraceae bacterium]
MKTGQEKMQKIKMDPSTSEKSSSLTSEMETKLSLLMEILDGVDLSYIQSKYAILFNDGTFCQLFSALQCNIEQSFDGINIHHIQSLSDFRDEILKDNLC